jgi:hypothetical protein
MDAGPFAAYFQFAQDSAVQILSMLRRKVAA